MADMAHDPIPEGSQRVLTLFHGPLADVRFPDADRNLLDADAEAVRSAAQAVLDADAALSAAKDTLDGAQRQLRERTQRALAYARIFAEAHPGVLDVLGESPASEVAPPKRRGRPKKVVSDTAELLPELAAE
jgi:hypothetical protein